MVLHEEMARTARTAVIVWARTHRNLSAGIPVPPEIGFLFDADRRSKQRPNTASKLVWF
jgi:hypothetical protein